MRIDLEQSILDLQGEPIKRPNNNKPFQLRDACQEALLATLPDEHNLAAKEKIARFTLAMKLNDKIPPDLEIEDLAKIKELVGKVYGTLVVARVYEMLESPKPHIVRKDGQAEG